MGDILITAHPKEKLLKATCPDCESELLCSTLDKNCPICSSELPEEMMQVDETEKEPKDQEMDEIQASVTEPRMKCDACGAFIFSNAEESTEDLVNRVFCPECGDAEVSACDTKKSEEEPTDDEEVNPSDAPEEEEPDAGDDEEVDLSAMEAHLYGQGTVNPFWLLCQNQLPILRLQATTPELKILAESHKFVDLFKQRATETSLTTAIREFGATVLHPKAISSMEMDAAIYEKLSATYLPKLLQCIAIAIEGMVRNIYPDLNMELKAAFYDEMKARGVGDPAEVVEAAFSIAGSKVFAAVLSKAMELFNKPEESLSEIKAMVMSSVAVKGAIPSDPEHDELKARLTAGNIPLIPVGERIVRDAAVSNVRERISFKIR